MAQVSTVQFNGSNAYELLVGEFVSSWPMGAVGLENISVGVQVYSATTGAGVKLTLRSFDAAGEVLSSQDYIYTVVNTSMWERAEKTWVCPTGIDRAELRITALVGTVLFAQPKIANGTTVGAYSTNYAPQLTLLTPTGIYTGTLTANQVIVSGGEDLASKLVTINANQISMTSDIDGVDSRTTVLEAGTVKLGTEYNGVTIDQSTGFKSVATIEGKTIEVKLNSTDGLSYYLNGNFKGGIKIANEDVSMISNIISNDATLNKYATVGTSGYGYGMSIYNKTTQATPILSVQAGTDGGAMLIDEKQNPRFHAYPNGTTVIRGNDLVEQLLFSENGVGVFGISTGHFVRVGPSLSFIQDANKQNRVYIDGTETTLISPNGTTYFKVVNGRVSVVVNGVEKIAWT